MRKSAFYEGMEISYLRFKDQGSNEAVLSDVTVVFVDDKFVEIEYRPSLGVKRDRHYYKTIPLKSIVIANRKV